MCYYVRVEKMIFHLAIVVYTGKGGLGDGRQKSLQDDWKQGKSPQN